MFIPYALCRLIYWAEAGVIKSSLDDGTDLSIVARNLGNVTAIAISSGNHNLIVFIVFCYHALGFSVHLLLSVCLSCIFFLCKLAV